MNKTGIFPPIDAGKSRPRSQGEMPFVLSCLEYLQLLLNSTYASSFLLEVSGIGLAYLIAPTDNTIVIHITHKANISQTNIDQVLRNAEDVINIHKDHYGWDWLKVTNRIDCIG